MLAVYFGYILLIAFDPAFLARRIGSGTTTIGIPIGLDKESRADQLSKTAARGNLT